MADEIADSPVKSRSSGRKWRKYPVAVPVPAKSSGEQSYALTDGTTIRDGFSNSTNINLIRSCIQRHSETDEEDPVKPRPEELTTFDDTSAYGIKELDRFNLVELEVKRLLGAIDDDKPLVCPKGGSMGSGTRPLLHDLFDIADQIICNLEICELDTQVMYMRSYRTLFQQDDYSSAREALTLRLNPDASQRHPVRLESENFKTYFTLIDYITAIMARLCIRSISSQSFQTRCIATLATLSTKLKLLEANAVQNAEISIDNGDDMTQELRLEILAEQTGIVGDSKLRTDDDDHNSEDNKAKAAIYNLASEGAVKPNGMLKHRLYNMEMAAVRKGVVSLLDHLLREIKGESYADVAKVYFDRDDDESAPAATVKKFNASSLVYGTGFASHSTLVSEYRDGKLEASASAQSLVACYNAFRILVQTARAVRSAPIEKAAEGPAWSFSWRMQELDDLAGDSDKVTTSSAHTVISVMVPLLCCSSKVAKLISSMLDLETFTSRFGRDMFETRSIADFEALAALETVDEPGADDGLTNPQISTLSRSVLARRRLAYKPESVNRRSKKLNRVDTDLVAKEFTNEMWRAQLHDIGQLIQRSWTIDEDAIVVPCDSYVFGVLTVCLIFVAGGIAIGFTHGGHIKGVDPFNITLFCWILAGFIAAASKSLKVRDWNWQDFLRRRCVCRSVTELASVTGVDPQHIIAYLLHNEDTTIIHVRGPYNNAFLRKSKDKSGFSIDEKLTLRTLLCSGLIPIQVATVKGPMLYVMEARKDGGDSARHYHEAGDHRDLVCRMSSSKNDSLDAGSAQDLVMEIGCPQWLRLLGFYNDLDRNFR
ncbi:hypothetical protein LTR95_007213 [Oleoguttula sp. CCFEE 5521]